MHNDIWDTIIIGGGSAGLSAALMLGRARRRVLVVDDGAPRNRFAPHMHGVLGRDHTSPLSLLADGRVEVGRYGVEFADAGIAAVSRDEPDAGRVGGGEHSDGLFRVALTGGDIHAARHLLVTTGLRDELPDIPGLAERWGTGAFSCPYCDGWEVRDGRIAVLAAGPNTHQVQLLRQWSPNVTYFTQGMQLSEEVSEQLAARGILVEERRIARVVSTAGALSGIELADGETVAVDAIFLGPRPLPNDSILRRIGAATHELMGGDWVVVDADGRTSVPGLWAAGNVISPFATVPVASAGGNTAGARINAELIDADIRDALAAHTG